MTTNTNNTNNTATVMSADARKALITYLESTILGYDKLNVRKQCGTLTPRQEARLVSLENMIRSMCVVCEANGIVLAHGTYPVVMANWAEGTRVYFGAQYPNLVMDAVVLTDLESVEKYKLSLVINAESTETLVGKIWVETKELVQLSWIFVKDSVSHVWAILRDGSKYLWGKLCDLFTWLVSLFKKKEATTVVPTAGGTQVPTAGGTVAPTAAPVAAPVTPVSTAGGTVDPTAPVAPTATVTGTVV